MRRSHINSTRDLCEGGGDARAERESNQLAHPASDPHSASPLMGSKPQARLYPPTVAEQFHSAAEIVSFVSDLRQADKGSVPAASWPAPGGVRARQTKDDKVLASGVPGAGLQSFAAGSATRAANNIRTSVALGSMRTVAPRWLSSLVSGSTIHSPMERRRCADASTLSVGAAVKMALDKRM